MNLFQKIFGNRSEPARQNTTSEAQLKKNLPPDWKEQLRKCNFFMARREIADFLHGVTQRAAAEGKDVIWKQEIGDGWNLFSDSPCYDTAVRYVAADPAIFALFSGCCPGGSLYRTGASTVMDFPIGGYSLGTNSADLQNLRELSSQQYEFFPRVFKGEVIYHAAPVGFLGHKWEFMVSLVNGRMIKWAASLEPTQNEIADMVHGALQHCEVYMGSPTDEKQGWFLWNKSDGNVILQVTQTSGLYDISIFTTSREIRSLQKL